jgi:hypothetical protein
MSRANRQALYAQAKKASEGPAYIRACDIEPGEILLTVANASGNVPEVEREVERVVTGKDLTTIICSDGSTHDYQTHSQIKVRSPRALEAP